MTRTQGKETGTRWVEGPGTVVRQNWIRNCKLYAVRDLAGFKYLGLDELIRSHSVPKNVTF